jgi:hypothetical protein
MSNTRPTRLALAAKAFLERIDNPTTRGTLETRAVNGGWVGAREAGCWDTKVSDAIAMAAWDSVLDLLRSWAAECDEPGATPQDRADVPPVA